MSRLFAGDRRVWVAAGLLGLPLALLILIWCLVPRDYLTGTNSVNVYTYVALAPPHQSLCVSGLRLPRGTERVALSLISRTRVRPVLDFALRIGSTSLNRRLPPQPVGPDRVSTATVPIPSVIGPGPYVPAQLCASAQDLVNWGGTPVPTGLEPLPTVNGQPLPVRIALFYLPAAGAKRSYLAAAGDLFRRAALFRAGFVSPGLYALIFFVVLPGVAVAAIRLLALAVAGRARRLALGVFLVCLANAMCWSVITPAFHGPDETEHFAYVSSIAERGQAPLRSPGALPTYSSSQSLGMAASRMNTNHQGADTRAPGLAADEQAWRAAVARTHPSSSDGGGFSAAGSSHGPLYYLALAPAYLLGGRSVFAQLTLARFASALIGSVSALFACLIMLEFAPRRAWLAVMAGLLVAFHPMYGFMSGVVDNDVGVNAGAAAVELLLIRMLLRGITVRLAAMTGALLLLLPIVKGTGYSLFPVAGLALLATLWRHHRRGQLAAFGAFFLAAFAAQTGWGRLSSVFHRPVFTTPSGQSPFTGPLALHQPGGLLSTLWETFLPRLPFMVPHFVDPHPGFTIFVVRGFAAFGWYTIYFPGWVYDVIYTTMLIVGALALVALVRERAYVRSRWYAIAILLLFPMAVIAGFMAAFYTPGVQGLVPEFGRYAFPAIAPLAVLVIASLHAFGRRAVLVAGTVLVVASIGLSYASQVLTLTGFFA